MIYDAQNWYWIVAGSTTGVYSSAMHAHVQADDAAYLAWINLGGVATKIASAAELAEVLTLANVPPYAPVSPVQARRALRAEGIYDQVEQAVLSSGDAGLIDSWEYATMWLRTDPWINSLGAELGLTSAQIDNLFIVAVDL